MTHAEKRVYLIQELLREQPQYRDMEVPQYAQEQHRLLRSLLNLRPPMTVSRAFLEIQDAYLSEVRGQKGFTDAADLTFIQERLCLWQGDITTLKVGAIVNAANAALLGCFIPCHGCIDNAIHSAAGLQLRQVCHEIMQAQGHEEPTGGAKLTEAYNLPCSYVLHTVGPIVNGPLTGKDCELLASCYRSCLELAAEKQIRSIAFCCISTGEYHFPQQRAAEIAMGTVQKNLPHLPGIGRVVFNVFKETDYEIYQNLLRTD